MVRFVVKRILLVIPTVLAVVLVMYFIMDLTPSDPATLILGERATQEKIDELNEELGYYDPFVVRYVRYIGDALQGDLGNSWVSGRSVFDEIVQRFPVTAKLALGAVIIAILIGLPIGILSAVKQYSIFDVLGTTFAMTLASVPGFWLGMMLIVLFAQQLNLLPSFGADTWKHFILPCLAAASGMIATQLRMGRTSMLESIRMDYIRTARAKGQKERLVVMRHALKNALLPIITVTGMDFGYLLGGAVVIETVFSLSGIGTLLIEAIRGKDIPVVLGTMMVLVVCFAFVMLLVDLLYAFVDPRIKARYVKSRH